MYNAFYVKVPHDNDDDFNHHLNGEHIAGIIPMHGYPLDFNFPWHDTLIPVSCDYLSIERCIVECISAGCDTIWISCTDSITPMFKKRLGDYAHKIISGSSFDSKYMITERCMIVPIFFIQIPPKDMTERDSFLWSMIHGALMCSRVSKSFSNWIIPKKFYISSPYGVNDPKEIEKYKKQIAGDSNVFVCDEFGKSIIDGKYLGFSIGLEDVIRIKKYILTNYTKEWYKDEGGKLKRLDKLERFSSRWITPQEVLTKINWKNSMHKVGVSWSYNINSWEAYCDYISSGHAKKLKRPETKILQNSRKEKQGLIKRKLTPLINDSETN